MDKAMGKVLLKLLDMGIAVRKEKDRFLIFRHSQYQPKKIVCLRMPTRVPQHPAAMVVHGILTDFATVDEHEFAEAVNGQDGHGEGTGPMPHSTGQQETARGPVAT